MIFKELPLVGAFEIELAPHRDERGFFMRLYDEEAFKERGLPTKWVQESRAFTATPGTIRGLHFLYPPHNESKLITMMRGKGYWVFVDIRKGSPTFGTWSAVTLSAEKPSALFLPRGFANGLCTLTPDCDVLYRMDAAYEDAAKSEFAWNDPDLAIPWPVTTPAALSERDQHAQSFAKFIEVSQGGLTL